MDKLPEVVAGSMSRDVDSRTRPRVGVLLPELDGEFYRPLVRAVCREAERLGVDLVFFPGHLPSTPVPWERQLGAAFELVDAQGVDGLLIFATLLQFYVDTTSLDRFVARFAHLPFVSVGHVHADRPAVLLENTTGFRQLVEHFIHVHGHRRIALIEGPPANRDAAERLRAYLDAHAAAGLEPDPRLRKLGHFDPVAARAAIEALWHEGADFTAVVCANDEMAHAVLAAAVERGVRVPEALAVGGFDDMLSVRGVGPSLTTVSQGIDVQATTGLRLLVDELSGVAAPRLTSVESRLVLRRSCGCRHGDLLARGLDRAGGGPAAQLAAAIDAPPGMADGLRDHIAALRDGLLDADGAGPFEAALVRLVSAWSGHGGDVAALQKVLLGLRHLVSPSLTAHVADRLLQGQLLLVDAIELVQNRADVARQTTAIDFRNEFKRRVATDDLDELLVALADGLRHLGVPDCSIALYDRPCTIDEMAGDRRPETSRIILALRDGVVQPQWDGAVFPTTRLQPAGLWASARPALRVVLPLFYLTHHFGFAVVDVRGDRQIHCEELRHELAVHIHHCLQVRELASARDGLRSDLERATEDNEALSHLAMRDPLTGLLNRRGFFERAGTMLSAARAHGRSVTAIFADLDGLKPINDRHGHEEGDHAIREAARLLREAFRSDDVVGRIGGDEFAVLTGASEADGIAAVAARVRRVFDRFNEGSGKPYRLGCSIGGHTLTAASTLSLDAVLAQADRELYAEKRARRSRA
ncbi:MAG: GGDEF domain-containing protein [Rhizobacter sp.]